MTLDPIQPYVSLIKWGLIIGFMVALTWFAHDKGQDDQAQKDASRIETLRGSLRAAAAALNADAAVFRAIDEMTRDSKKQGERVKADAARATREAEKQRDELADRVAAINREREQERTTCSEAERRICGKPLR